MRAGPCPICGEWMDPALRVGHPHKAVLDHPIPLALRPRQGYHHTIPICNACNLRKHATPAHQYRARPEHQSRAW